MSNLISWKDTQRGNSNFGVIITGESHDFALAGCFEYIDLGNEVQFIIISILRVQPLELSKLSDLIGLPVKIVKNIILRMTELGLVNQTNDTITASEIGLRISRPEDIVEREVVQFIAEICTTSHHFMNSKSEYLHPDQYDELTTEIDINFEEIGNLPPNLVKMENDYKILRHYSTLITKWEHQEWQIQSNSGESLRISNELCQLKFYQKYYDLTTSEASWFDNTKHDYDGFSIEMNEDGLYGIKAQSLKDLDSYVMIKGLKTWVLLEHQNEGKIMLSRSVNIEGNDGHTEKLIFLKALQSKPEQFWLRRYQELMEDLRNLWVGMTPTKSLPDMAELVDLAYLNGEYNLVIQLRALGDIIEQIY